VGEAMEPMATAEQASFLLEAWESLAAIEGAQAAWRSGAAEQARSSLAIVCHRLRGTSALYGWARLAAVAERLEDLVGRQPAEPLTEDSPFAQLLGQAMTTLPALLDRIAGQRCDQLPAAAALVERVEAMLAASSAVPRPAAAAERDGDVDAALERFRRHHREELEYFALETEEHLGEIDAACRRLASSPGDLGAVDLLFRHVHTLKGAALMVGCRPVGELAHRAEDLLARHQRHRQPLPVAGVAALAAALRALRAMLDVLVGAAGSAAGAHRRAVAALAAASADEVAPPAAAAGLAATDDAVAAPVDEPAGGDAGPQAEKAVERTMVRVDRARLDKLLDLVGDLLIVRSRLERHLDALAGVGEQMDWNRRRMAETMGRFSDKYLDPSLDDAPLGEAPSQGSPSGTPPSGASPSEASDSGTGVASEVRSFEELGELELDRYDDFNFLARRVAEMSDDVALVHLKLDGASADLRSETEQLRRLSRQLRSEISRTRLVPVGPLFSRLRRLAGEVAEETGKRIEVELEGTDTEIDGALIERLFDPLLHLLQNAVIHGIEAPEVRLAAGKPAGGRVVLRASTHGTSVRIEVEDDGAGIDSEALCAAAVHQRFLTAEAAAELDGDQARELIFLPGLSTLEQITRRAGRGVGMDAVRDSVLRLEGDLEVASERRQRTRFTLTLPASLVLTAALMVRVGGATYGVPLPAVRRVVELDAGEVPADGEGVVGLDGEDVEFFFLHEVLGLRPAAAVSPTLSVLSLRLGGRRLALAVDAVEDIAEITVRPFDELLAGTELFSGGALMADGRVVLLLDSVALFALRQRPSELPAAVEPAPSAAPRRAGADILLVDDSLSVRKVLTRTLERAGFAVATAADGIEAVAALRERPFDAVVTDLEMPRLNGFELIEDLRRRFSPAELPIFIITTRASRKHALLARRLGASGYLYKPVDDRQLVGQLRLVLAADAVAGPASVAAGREN